MDFILNFLPSPPVKRLHFNQPAFLTGSCFSDHISGLLNSRGVDVISQPFGVVFNPVSITQQLVRLVQGRLFTREDLILFNDLWHSWLHHGRFSGTDPEAVLLSMNKEAERAKKQLERADVWIGVTLGSAHVYALAGQPDFIVSNCHKYPSRHFTKRLLTVTEVVKSMEELMSLLPSTMFVFTVSPVRHIRDGLVENNQSKATLLLAIQQVCELYPDRAYYFPAYELVNDQLRDYRFFETDMVHPNQQAVRFVWERFTTACYDEISQEYLKAQERLLALKSHRVMHEGTEAHRQLLARIAAEEAAIRQRFL